MFALRCLLSVVGAAVVLSVPTAARGQSRVEPPHTPFPYAERERRAASLSLDEADVYLDGVAKFWMTTNSCGACHANYSYLMLPARASRPALMDQTRQFMENRTSPPTGQSMFSDAETGVGVAFALVWDDRATAGHLRPTTAQALTRMWSKQRSDGTWRKLGCGVFPVAENDAYYTATLAALAAGMAPDEYAKSSRAKNGIAHLRQYFAKTPPPNLHHQAMLLWASLHLDGLMTKTKQEETIKALLARQRNDGGWNLENLHGGYGGSSALKGDGYGTGFTLYVLRQARVPASRAEIVRGIRWLSRNQRTSGRWFTPSPAEGARTEGGVGTRDLYIQNLGTAFAVLALQEYGIDQASLAPRPVRRVAGLSMRERLITD